MASKNDTMIAALLREREGYERRGLEDRVRQVDEQLKHHGYAPEDDSTGPRGRTATPQQTAQQGKPEPKKPAAKKAAAAPSAPQSE
ncbi:hypothetical protein [Streptomyces sp. V3I7]|uniref:hypothetical protein n=1 Tax=Streptomyces sp. V3I7 TaxID=3042278 RepID=UPI0027852ECA|nr:hypothetical protein [Streptomyces sp. V3I7]MDQ0992168.1 hypothetical protein [Streptomyces sp. V3I7]